MQLHLLWLAGLAPVFVSAPSAQDDPAPGFELSALPYPGGMVTATLANGDVLSWDGVKVLRSAPSGALLKTLATFAVPVYPSFVAVAPGESYAVIGESSLGDLFRVNIAAGGATLLTNLFFNFDAKFEPGGQLVVSAATHGWSTGNDLVRVDPASGAETPLVHVEGPSGPLAFDPAGNLFYATQSPLFPAPPGSTDVLVWPAPLLDGSAVRTEDDAFLLGFDFDGGSSLVYDGEVKALYMADSNIGTGTSRIVRVNGSLSSSQVVLTGTGGLWYSNLELVTAPGGAIFGAYQPTEGGTLRVNATDFAGFAERSQLRPARPTLALSGPGLSGPGPFTVALGGGPPQGHLVLAFATQDHALASEIPLLLGGVAPIFLGLDLAHAFLVPGSYPLDAQGAAAPGFTNPGGLEGLLALQGLVLDPSLFPLGTTAVALN